MPWAQHGTVSDFSLDPTRRTRKLKPALISEWTANKFVGTWSNCFCSQTVTSVNAAFDPINGDGLTRLEQTAHATPLHSCKYRQLHAPATSLRSGMHAEAVSTKPAKRAKSDLLLLPKISRATARQAVPLAINCEGCLAVAAQPRRRTSYCFPKNPALRLGRLFRSRSSAEAVSTTCPP
jgi:hypothetical protein